MRFLSYPLAFFAAVLLFSVTASANDEKLLKAFSDLIENQYDVVLEMFPDAVEAADLPNSKVKPDPARRRILAQKILESLRNNGGVTSKHLDEIDRFFGGKVIERDEFGAATVDATDMMGRFFRQRYGDEPYQIFRKHYDKMVDESQDIPSAFTYTWSSWGQHHELSEAHVNVKKASKLFMSTQFKRFLEMKPAVSDLFRLFEHLPETDPFYIPYRNQLASQMYARIQSKSATQKDYLNWHWLKHGYPHKLDFEGLGIPNTDLKTDLEEFAARFYRKDFTRAIAGWLTRSSFDVPQQSHGGRFNDFNAEDSFRRYQVLVGKILGVAVDDKETSIKDLVRPIFETMSKEYPRVAREFGPSLPEGILVSALESGFEQIHRKDEFLAAYEAMIQELSDRLTKKENAKPRKIRKPGKWRGEGGCDFTGLSDSPEL
jgi:hypothetical protein